MYLSKRLLFGLCLAAAAAYVGLAASDRRAAVAAEPGDKENADAAKDRRTAFIAAFDSGDAKAVAGFWAPDASYVDEVGGEYQGREAIEKLYEKVFAARKGAKLAINVTASKALSPDIVVNDGFTVVTPADGGVPTSARFTALLAKKDGQWYLQSVRDSVAFPPSNASHFEDLEWLIGEWTGENEKGDSATAEYEWQHDQNFIECTYAATLNGVPVSGGTQWIGWDAIEKRIRSWTFYSGGGFGEGSWTKEGNDWVIKVSARTAAGNQVTATNTITKTDDDHMIWQLAKLTVDGKSLPDMPAVKMKRVPAQP